MIDKAQTEAIKESADNSMKPLDRAIQGVETEFEEEIGLYQTFGGD